MENRQDSRHGQVLVLVALSLLVLFGFVALAIDVGHIYRERRSMQNAADAGALAGAYELCYGTGADPEQDAIDAAENYATDRNGADGADIQVNDLFTITVVATQTVNTFFARLVGFNEIDVSAAAAAACGKAKAAGLVWPIGFDISGFPDQTECGAKVVLWEDSKMNCCDYNCRDYYDKQGNKIGEISPVTVDYSSNCDSIPPEEFNLDPGYFYRPDYMTLQGRVWLDFSAGLLDLEDPCDSTGCGSSELSYRLSGDNNKNEPCISWVETPVCVPGKMGLDNNAWTTAGEQNDKIALIPLYDPDESTSYNGDPTNPCVITTGDPGDACSSSRFQLEDFGCVRVIGSYYFREWGQTGSGGARIIMAEIPCMEDDDGNYVMDESGEYKTHAECSSLLGYTTGERPEPGDPKAVNLIPLP